MTNNIHTLLKTLLLGVLLFSPATLFAQKEPISARSINVHAKSSDIVSFAARPAGHAVAALKTKNAPALRGNIRGFGKFDLYLTSKRFKNWPAYFQGSDGKLTIDPEDVTLLRGMLTRRIAGTKSTTPISGSLISKGSNRRLVLLFDGQKARSGVQYYYRIDLALPKSGNLTLIKAKLRRTPDIVLKNRSCGADGHNLAEKRKPLTSAARFVTAAATLRQIDLTTDADFEFYQDFGSSTNSEIATIVNQADLIYRRDLGMTFLIGSQRTRTSSTQPVTATDSEDMLNQYTNYIYTNPPSGNRDVSHLFSGKDMDGSTVGIAWIGTVCASSVYNTGVTQFLSTTLNYIIFAHELGHNFSAEHDTSLPLSIMYPSVSTSMQAFSSTSKSQIASHLATYNSCLANVSDTNPTPTPTATPAAPTPPPNATATPTPPPGSTPGSGPGPAPQPTQGPTSYTINPLRNKKSSRATVIRAVLLAPDSTIVARGQVTLLRGATRVKAVKAALTNAEGLVQFKVKVSGMYRLRYVTPESEIIQTNLIRVR